MIYLFPESEKTSVRVNLKSTVTSIKQEGKQIAIQVNGQKLLDKVIIVLGLQVKRTRLVKIFRT